MPSIKRAGPATTMMMLLLVLLASPCFSSAFVLPPLPSSSPSSFTSVVAAAVKKTSTAITTATPHTHTHTHTSTRLFTSSSPLSSSSSTDGTKDTPLKPPLPFPKIGDVVRYPGKWEADYGIGQIRFLQKIASRDEWIADITPFKDVGEDLYRAEKGGGSVTHPVASIQPLSHFFIGSTDAYKVTHTKGVDGTRVPVQMALAYNTDGFTLAPRKVDKAAMEKAKNAYEELKKRILKDTAVFGAASTVLAGLNAGAKDAAIFFAGVLGSLLYLVLLQKKADAMGSGPLDELGSSKGKNPLTSSLGNTRFLVPVVLIAGLAYKNILFASGGGGDAGANIGGLDPADITALTAAATTTTGTGTKLFNYVPPDEFWAATLGFLSYRIPMLAREVNEVVTRRSPNKNDPTMGGSVRAGMALVDRLQGKDKQQNTGATQVAASVYRNELTVVLVSGPEGMGKRALVKRLVQEDPLERYAEPVWVTTRDPREGEEDGRDYHFMEDFAFQVMREQERFLVSYKDERGDWYGLRPNDVSEVMSKLGKVSVLALDAFAADRLLYLNDARLIGVWVTLNTVDQLRDRYQKQIAAAAAAKDGEGEDKEKVVAKEVDAAVTRATGAIEHALLETSRGFYEHTIYDDQGAETSYKKLRDFADFALSL